jgi:hypothetical protein
MNQRTPSYNCHRVSAETGRRLVADSKLELREVATDVMSRVIEGTASPFALIRRSDLARLKQAVEQEDA